jgi:hypothetical protein
MPVPNTFGTATSAIPLSQLDANFATPITIGNTAVQLGNTVTTLNNMTLANVTISSGTITITNVAVTTANVSGTANVNTLVVVGNETVGGNTTITGNITAANANVTSNLVLSGGTANGVAYLDTNKVLTTGSALVFDGTNLGLGVTPTAKLQISVASAAVNGTKGVRITNPAGTIVMLECGSGGDSFVGTESGSDFNIRTGNIIRATFDNAGNLGIGETSPGARIDVKSAATDFTGLILNNTSTSGKKYNIVSAGSGSYFDIPTGAFGIRDLTAGATRMVIDTSGNLLVGTTSALNGAARLDVSAPSGNNVAATFKNDAGANQWVTQIWNAGTSGDNGFVQFATETSYAGRGSITYNRAGGLVAYNVTSDYRAKDIYGPVTGSGTLIDSVPVYMGKMKGATQERPMFIAHETPVYAHTGIKDAVDKDGKPVYQQMDASALIPVMWAEIQSLRKRLATAGI